MGTKDLDIARRFKELVERKVTPREIRVFGSRARGTAAQDADLDIFVAIDHCEDVVVVPVVVDQERLVHGPLRESAFIRNVFREGILV